VALNTGRLVSYGTKLPPLAGSALVSLASAVSPYIKAPGVLVAALPELERELLILAWLSSVTGLDYPSPSFAQHVASLSPTFQVGEHPAFGGVNPVHTEGSWHYRNGAIDVNFGAGESAAEKAAINPLISHITELGYGVIWLSEGHFDHAHFDLGGSRAGIVGDFAGSAYGPSVFEISLVPAEH
jgi:hypothetical protein